MRAYPPAVRTTVWEPAHARTGETPFKYGTRFPSLSAVQVHHFELGSKKQESLAKLANVCYKVQVCGLICSHQHVSGDLDLRRNRVHLGVSLLSSVPRLIQEPFQGKGQGYVEHVTTNLQVAHLLGMLLLTIRTLTVRVSSKLHQRLKSCATRIKVNPYMVGQLQRYAASRQLFQSCTQYCPLKLV